MHPNDPRLRSFLEVPPQSHFPIQNLPFGVFSTAAEPSPRVGVALGDWVVDVAALEEAGLLAPAPGRPVFRSASLNAFLGLGRAAWSDARRRLSELLRRDTATLRDDAALRARAIVRSSDATLRLPLEIAGYTDFYSSREHATNVGKMFRDPQDPLLPNWLEMPVAYNGRASSIVVSGTPVRRPWGQVMVPGSTRPAHRASRKLDFELETAFVIGVGNELGCPVPVDRAEEHVFGMVLMNDWSARDIQQWEYLPLGPFNGKSFATSISPWVVPLEALEPFRVPGPAQVPTPLQYLAQTGPHAFDVELEASLRPAGGGEHRTLCRTNLRHLYWSMAQQLAHHASNGCNLRVGDLLGSGTISGPTTDSFGSLLELTWNGARPLALSDGTSRSFLEDGDEVVITGWCAGDGYRVGFGEASGRVLPALPHA